VLEYTQNKTDPSLEEVASKLFYSTQLLMNYQEATWPTVLQQGG